ncbi:unnamed protein product [Lymnaea stagnalis]|uniref:Uncharacterized protein n=1 Tax=Lymnaea stagnalis TaxID=6523 RepID=A0AAV2IIY0_LYMST
MFGKPVIKMKKFISCFTRQASQEKVQGKPRRKLVIVGDGACGKTSLVTRMSTGDYVDIGYVPTVFENQLLDVNTGSETVELVIFDTAGQEDYDRLRPFSYNDVDIALICFSLADADTLLNVMSNWAPEIRYFCGNAPVILVGNKKDLRDAELSANKASAHAHECPDDDDPSKINLKPKPQRPVSEFRDFSKSVYKVSAPVKHSEGALIAGRIGAAAYFETSALTGENVEELLLAATKAAILGPKKSQKFKPFVSTMKSWKSLGELVN